MLIKRNVYTDNLQKNTAVGYKKLKRLNNECDRYRYINIHIRLTKTMSRVAYIVVLINELHNTIHI